ncbi:Stf0 sulfotransferase domain protein [Sulfitobacter noctilucicola]|uniref:LPS sulfotransferase NodH n=1 Tax=Sulfitobacter noctilucicola TaxID=1342301 RepID=A0A7W6M5C0_9RHOB|nr:Stf0 family sulfotransferase [Sulfitobacter noctilucicola]KIN62712.1 Stf0 sulfotransferase domain protein [Sulfitobacter noctilucicola]MBB4172755.1 LPS sulfotransferase NodH [Sulfitobacter noctilucicola]
MSEYFQDKETLNRERFAKDMMLPPAKIRYIMYFTPRSGSSWVTDIATRTKRLSNPGECYNPSFMPNMSKALNAANMREYQDILERRRNTNNVYGFQITYHQLKRVFGSDEAFIEMFPVDDWHSFWLIRENIVAQAISLFKMQQTQISHAPQTSDEELASKDSGFAYDGDEIKRWLSHILFAEQKNEELFENQGIKPFRLSYEQNTSIRPNRVLNTMGRHIGIPHMRMPLIESGHKRIATSINDVYAERFREEYADFVKEVDEKRQKTLSLIDNYRPVPGNNKLKNKPSQRNTTN